MLIFIFKLDIYVAVTCSLSEIYDTRDFYKPIVLPYDIEIALNANQDNNLKFSYDYNNFLKESDILCGPEPETTDISMLTNAVRSFGKDNDKRNDTTDYQIALKPDGTVASSSDFGAGYLSARTWTGLEQKLGQNEPKLAEEGQTGLAQAYKNELNI